MAGTNAKNVAFVRETMLPEKAPPITAIGPIGWARENLFSGPFNTIVTLVSLAFIYLILSILIPWASHNTWNATSLADCREITGKDHGAACWGVINERWRQILFGNYPVHLRWRPILDLVLLGVALAPILFTNLPRKLLIVSAAYPFIMPWLIWGGTIWVPVLAAAGFAIAFFIIKYGEEVIGSLAAMIVGVLAAIIWWLFLLSPVSDVLASILPIGLEPLGSSRDIGGLLLAFVIGVVAIGCSLPIGIVLALGRQSDLMIVKTLCVCFIEFIRGVPLITLLFVASTLLNIFMPPGTNFDIVLRVIIMVTLFSSAYMAEVIRGGLAALPKGQYEGGDSLGLNYWQAQRLIIMPQALKISIPGIVSTFIGLFKDTTLVSVIGLMDPIGWATAIRADTNWIGILWELYAFIAVLFFIVCFGMSRYSMYLERKLKTSH